MTIPSNPTGSDKVLWEEAVVRFNRVRQLRVLSPHLPLGEGIRLDPAVYQTVLLDLLNTDHPVRFCFSLGYLLAIFHGNIT